MQPTVGNVFVKKADKKVVKFEVVDNSEAKYEVTAVANDVTKCKVGDFILFRDSRSYKFEGKDVHVIDEGDIVAVRTNPELK